MQYDSKDNNKNDCYNCSEQATCHFFDEQYALTNAISNPM